MAVVVSGTRVDTGSHSSLTLYEYGQQSVGLPQKSTPKSARVPKQASTHLQSEREQKKVES